MIKLLIGGSPCTHWSIAQKNNRETEPNGLGWELFKNYLIAKEKFKPDYFLYENNKSAAQPIKDQISRELGVNLMYINSALVSAQNRQRFYAFNWKVEQPEDRGILLRDILETGVTDRDKSRCVTESVGRTAYREYFMKQQNTSAFEPVGIGYRGRAENGKWKKRYESSGEPKANALTTAPTDSMVAEAVRIPEYGNSDKARPLGAYYSNNCGGFEQRMFSDNPNKQQVDMIAEPVRVGGMPRPNGEISKSQAKRIYSVDGKSVNLTANGGGEGAKTGLYAVPINTTDDEKSQTIKATYKFTSIANICCYNSTYGATGVALPTDLPPSEQYRGKGKDKNAMKRIYEVKDGIITIKDKQYPIKLPDGFYIIRKLTPVECERLQTLPDGYTRVVSDAQRYKSLGNGWTAEVIIHILNGVLKNVPRDEEIIVLSMYDGIGTGRYCLDAMGFTNVRYYAYEIDKFAKQVAMSNYPDIIQCGDAFDLRHPDWTIGY